MEGRVCLVVAKGYGISFWREKMFYDSGDSLQLCEYTF